MEIIIGLIRFAIMIYLIQFLIDYKEDNKKIKEELNKLKEEQKKILQILHEKDKN